MRLIDGKKILSALALLVSMNTAIALEFNIAPIVYIEKIQGDALKPDVAKELLKGLSDMNFKGELDFNLISGAAAPISQIEAIQLAQDADAAFLFYGFVRQDVDSLNAEIKLLDAETNKVVMTFYASDRTDQHERMMRDLLSKIETYFRDDLGYGHEEEKPVDRNIWGLEGGLGYWTPGTSEWITYTMGIFSLDVGARYIPVKPVAVASSRPLYYILGADLEYALGMNQPGYEASFLHTAMANISLEAAYDLNKRNRIGLALQAGLRLDWLVQTQLYQGTVVTFSPVPDFAIAATYAFRLTPKMELGLELECSFAAYTVPLVAVAPKIVYIYWFGDGQ